MKYKHYAPRCELYMINADNAAFADYVNNKKDAAVLCFEEEADNIKVKYKLIYGSQSVPEITAQRLFDALRELDRKSVKKAYVHAPASIGVGLAVYNRLQRACEFREIKL